MLFVFLQDEEAKVTCDLEPACGLDDTCEPQVHCPKAETFDQAYLYSQVSIFDENLTLIYIRTKSSIHISNLK
jgi:hypothetical protein